MLLTLLFYLFVVTVTIQSIYYLFLFGNFSFSKQKDQAIKDTPVSVIICARNEADNLRSNLESILTQNHSTFEIIVVNDASTDETSVVLKTFEKRYQNLFFTTQKLETILAKKLETKLNENINN